MSHRPNFPPNPYAQGMPGWRGDPYQQQNSPGSGMRFSGTPRHHNPRGFSPRGPSPHQGGPSPHQGGGRPRFSPSQYQQTPYTPGGHRGGGGRERGGRGGGYQTPGGSPRGRYNTPYSGGRGRGSHGSPGGARIEQYYKHSMVEDPWRTLVQNSQQTASEGAT